jgi:hypothetical protein
MEVCGTEYDLLVPKWKLLVGALVSATWIYGVRCAEAIAMNRVSRESLTGTQRRQVFERQRQEMIQGAEAPDTTSLVVGRLALVRTKRIAAKWVLSEIASPCRTRSWLPMSWLRRIGSSVPVMLQHLPVD